jgi:hypothetical protein
MGFVDEYGFDGVDIDWEYPVSGGLSSNIYRPEDRENYTLLLSELRRQLDSLEVVNQQDYLLTIAAPANPEIIANLEVELIHLNLDWINVMTYDFHGPWGGPGDIVTNFNTPLYVASDDPTPEPYHSTFNLDHAINEYLDLTVPEDKLHPGLAFYGRGFGSVENVNNGLFANYSGASWAGTWEPGVFDYWDLAANYVNIGGYVAYWHEEAKVPWVHSPITGIMISYDNPISITEKGNYIIENDLAGAMFWEFSADRDSVLLETIYDVLESGGSDLGVTLTPSSPPIIIPAGGGVFEFTADIENQGISSIDFDAWIDVHLPGGSTISPLLIREGLTLTGGALLSRDLSQAVPGSAPTGVYSYRLNVGTFPDEIVAFDEFDFEKSVVGSDATISGWDLAGWEEEASPLTSSVSEFGLLDVYPNPFNPITEIKYSIDKKSPIKIIIYDVRGSVIARLVDHVAPAGSHSATFDGSHCPSGVFFGVLTCDDYQLVKKLLLVK